MTIENNLETQSQWWKILEKRLLDSKNRNKHRYREEFYPDRIVEPTKRTMAFLRVIKGLVDQTELDETKKTELAERLFDLVVYNCYGRVFPVPNTAGDFVGVPDMELKKGDDYQKFQNCITLIKLKKDGRIGTAGGFNDIGESPAKTVGREALEEEFEEGSEGAKNCVWFGERSDKKRDERFEVMSMCGAGCVDPDQLKAGDDAGEVMVVKLINDDGSLNQELFTGNQVFDVKKGQMVAHNGFRADHQDIIKDFYHYWEVHGKEQGLSLDQMLKKMKYTVPQEWFQNYERHPEGFDKYEFEEIDGKKMMLTPNIKFGMEQAQKILKEYGVSKDNKIAKKFIKNSQGVDMIPLFPQAAVTFDCVIFRGDKLVVHKFKNAEGQEVYSLPGSFYSPERNDEGLDNIRLAAARAIQGKYGGRFDPKRFLGAVGGKDVLGELADKRYPRNSFIWAGKMDEVMEVASLQGPCLPQGSEIVEIDIWKDKQNRILSDEILKMPWAYYHSEEIIQTLVKRLLDTLDPGGQMTAEELLEKYKLERPVEAKTTGKIL